jgi:hypothetical protein
MNKNPARRRSRSASWDDAAECVSINRIKRIYRGVTHLVITHLCFAAKKRIKRRSTKTIYAVLIRGEDPLIHSAASILTKYRGRG